MNIEKKKKKEALYLDVAAFLVALREFLEKFEKVKVIVNLKLIVQK